MPTLPNEHSVIRFGPFEVDLSSGEIHKHGRKIKLQEQPFQVLAMLLAHPGKVITREELRFQLWPADTFVDFDTGLNSAIKKLREALGDSAEEPTYIETLTRRGYRFISTVESPPALSAKEPKGTVSGPMPRSPEEADGEATAPRRGADGKGVFRRVASGALALAAVTVFLYLLNLGGLRQKLFVGAPPPKIRSLAVLPLENLSGDPNEDYFADAMSEELTTELGKISALRVVSRTSVVRYKGTKKSLPEIARELNVDAVVEGAVLRSADRVRITTQLIRAATDEHLWAETYERDLRDVVALQGEVARAVAKRIEAQLTPHERVLFATTRPVDPLTYQAYLKGRYYLQKWSDDGSRLAVQYFQEAIDRDANYAPAYVGLGECYSIWPPIPREQATPRARDAAVKALEIDETLGEAHAVLATIRFYDEWKWADADTEFKRAIELNPSYAEAHHMYSHFLMEMGRTEESLAESRRSLELDPLSPAPNLHLGWHFLFAHKYDQATEQLRKTLQMDPNYVEAHLYLGEAYEEKGMNQEAVAEFQKAVALSGRTPQYVAALGHAYALLGRRSEALRIIVELQSKRPLTSSYEIATVYAGLGDKDKAFKSLEKAYQHHDFHLAFSFNVNPKLDSLRSDPRYADILGRMDLPPKEQEIKGRGQ